MDRRGSARFVEPAAAGGCLTSTPTATSTCSATAATAATANTANTELLHESAKGLHRDIDMPHVGSGFDQEGRAAGESNVVAVVVASGAHVKPVKSWLEARSLFGKHIARLAPRPSPADSPADSLSESRTGSLSDSLAGSCAAHPSFAIHTTIPTAEPVSAAVSVPELALLPVPYHELRAVAPTALALVTTTASSSTAATATATATSPLVAFTAQFLVSYPPPPTTTTTAAQLLAHAPKRSVTYAPLLLLPPNAFTAPPWTDYLAAHPDFFPAMAAALAVTHIARNGPIAVTSVLRSPRIEFLFPHGYPTSHSRLEGADGERGKGGRDGHDYDAALWVTTTQHGLHQTWSPQHTMFSRGNVREKARVLAFPRVADQDVADLFAGIGYFVFSYLRAGARRVWCWEVNPWSVEALRRGCLMNGFSVRVVPPQQEQAGEWEDGGERVIVFAESNEHAVRRMAGRRVRHVNLGLLPSSSAAYATAVQLLLNPGREPDEREERERGGDRDGHRWAHVHENVGAHEIDARRSAVEAQFRALAASSALCEHVERVKTFAPGVVHCVFDVGLS